MKKVALLLCLSFLIFACQQKNTELKSENEIKQQVDSIINNWHKAAAEANYTNYFDALDKNSVFIGTDASENWNKVDFSNYSKPHFDKGKAWSFTPLTRNIYVSKQQNIVWFDELLKTDLGICRGSGVLEKDPENWKIKQYVLSITVPNDNIAAILSINKVKDSVLLETFK